MELKRIEDRLSRLTSLVEGWKREGGVSRIERDIALEELRRIYDEVAECEVTTEPKGAVAAPMAEVETVEESPAVVEEEVVAEAESEAESAVEEVVEEVVDSISDMGDAFDDALDIDAILGIGEPEPTSEPEPEPIAEPMPEPKVGGGLFDIDDIPVRTKAGRKMIALYNAPVAPKAEPKTAPEPASIPEPIPAPIPEPEPVVEHVQAVEAPKRLADVLGSGVTVLGDKIAADEAPTTPFNRITDLRKAIGLNDKFLMIRDLFGGDAAMYEDTIDRLNEFDDLDECMIFIVENFRWNPDSEGAKLLVSLIERKLA